MKEKIINEVSSSFYEYNKGDKKDVERKREGGDTAPLTLIHINIHNPTATSSLMLYTKFHIIIQTMLHINIHKNIICNIICIII